MVAAASAECPRPRAWPYSWHITPWMSKWFALMLEGPSAQVHSSQKMMRHPSEMGVSVKARTPVPPQVSCADTMLLLVPPMPLALPDQKASKLAPPLPSVLPPTVSPMPFPCRRLPH